MVIEANWRVFRVRFVLTLTRCGVSGAAPLAVRGAVCTCPCGWPGSWQRAPGSAGATGVPL